MPLAIYIKRTTEQKGQHNEAVKRYLSEVSEFEVAVHPSLPLAQAFEKQSLCCRHRKY